jgi:glucose-6-phosphate isomerase
MQSTIHNSSHKKGRLNVLGKKLSAYSSRILKLTEKNDYTANESSLVVAGDDSYQQTIKKALGSFKTVKNVVLVGIGGSSLGTEAVYHALKTKTSPSLHVLDTIHKDSLEQFSNLVKNCTNPKQLACVIVSKSGTTTETLTNAMKVMEIGEKKFGPSFLKQVIFIGDKDSEFYKIGEKKNILCFSFPSIIGGRYSVFTAVGIVPLTLLGIDTQALRKGALAILDKKEFAHIETQACALALHAEAGVHTVNFFTFSDRLELIGFWYRQLLAESVGKNMTTKGASFAHQLLPIVSTAADLHSMTELYLGGYQNMFTHFISYTEEHPFQLLKTHWLLDHVPFLKRKSSEQINNAIQTGVIQAYQDQKLPYRVTELSACTPYEIGYLLASLMAEVMCLAHVLDIDPFHQPSVELYKKHTRVRLNS